MTTSPRNASHRTLALGGALGLSLLFGVLVGCYDPQLGDNPWLCSADTTIPECPQDYACVQGVCVKTSTQEPADGGADAGMSRIPDPLNCPDKDVEPNEDKAKAIPVGYGQSVNWAICTSSDKDYFKIELNKNTQLQVRLKYQPQAGNNGNLDIIFFGGNSTETSGATKSFFDRDEMGKTVGRLLVAKADSMMTKDTFYLKVTSLNGDTSNPGGPNFYDLDITPAK